MAFRGPSRLYQPPGPSEALAQALDAAEARQARRESVVTPAARTDLLELQDRQQERQESGRAELAMTPGVRKGVADSPLLNTFQRFGDTYSYDPQGAADQAGAVAGSREAAQQKAKYQSMLSIPGISQKAAARSVYGRSGVMDTDEEDSYRNALGNYMRVAGRGDPMAAREAAAKAIEAGAAPNIFPDKFMGEGNKLQKVVRNGVVVGTFDPDTGEVTQTGETAPDPAAARAEAVQQAQAERAAAIESRFARSQAGTARREMQGLLGLRPRASQYVDPLTRQPDEAALGEAVRGWRADSTITAGAMQEANEYMRSLGTGPAVPTSGAPAAPPKTAEDLRKSGLFDLPGQSSAGQKKTPSAQQMKDAAKDPGYRQHLIQRGYDMGGGNEP